LGRGLDALLPTRREPETSSSKSAVFDCPIERLVPQEGQPRRHFDGDALEELAATIRHHGVIQPLVVRRLRGDRYQIIAGERRWRAAQRAGITDVPVVVKDVAPEQVFELALIENLQREDLNPIEVAEALERLLSDDTSHEELAQRVGKSRSAVTNALRLLKLPAEVRAMVRDGRLQEGHARALLGASDRDTLLRAAERAVRGKLSVRQVEALVRGGKGDEAKPKDEPSANVRDLELRLTRRLGARVRVEGSGRGGRIVVSYADLDELDRILQAIGKV
jgi:ParB family chromosome partitioning protein